MHNQFLLHYCLCRCYKGLYVKELVSITNEGVLIKRVYVSLHLQYETLYRESLPSATHLFKHRHVCVVSMLISSVMFC